MTRTRKQVLKKRRLGRSTLFLIALTLACSGALRFGDLGIAIADDVAHLLNGTSAQQSLELPTPEEDVSVVLAALQEREKLLQSKEQALVDRLQALAIADQQINQKLEALKTAEEKLAGTIADAKSAASDDLEHLTLLYENMKPKQAIPLFEQMEPNFAAGFLSRMKPAVAAQIMSGLKPQTSYAISVILAGRNSKTPNE